MALLGEELTRLGRVGEHHRRLAARLLLVLLSSLVVVAAGTTAIYICERDVQGTQIHTVGQAAFFVVTQLLTVSSSMKNPLSPAGRAVDVLLELWAVVVVAGSAGAVASFYQSTDRQ